MAYNILADLVVIIHLSFILFVLFGALAVLKWPKIALVHIPFLVWGIATEFFNIICPLTPLENLFRKLSGDVAYNQGFIEHYIVPLIYPEELTRESQFLMGGFCLLLNIVIYGVILYRFKNHSNATGIHAKDKPT
jgi:hypothetical protein